MDCAEWYETVFVIGKRTDAGTFDDRNCKVFDKNGYHWIINKQFYELLTLPEDPCKWNQVCLVICYQTFITNNLCSHIHFGIFSSIFKLILVSIPNLYS